MKRFSRKLALLLCVLLTLSASLPALAAAKSGTAASVALTVEGDSAAEEGFVLRAKAQGLSSGAKATYDFLVKKPGAEKYVYLKKGSASASIRYCPKEEGTYTFRVRLHENGAAEYAASSAVSAVLGSAAAEEPAASGPKWNPAAGYPALPKTIAYLDELFNGVNRAVVTYRTMPTIQVRYLQLQKFWNQIEQNTSPLHSAYLEDGRIRFAYRYSGKGQYADLTVVLPYDAAGQLIRNYLYGEPIEEHYTLTFQKKVNALLKKLKLSGKTDYEKAAAIHDFLVSNYHYDTTRVGSGGYTSASYTAMGLLENGYAVCEGYAELFGLLAILSGLKCYAVTGTMNGGSHMWNLVSIDGAWYHIDCTADDPLPDVAGRIERTYFLLGDDAMRAANYSWDDRFFVAAPASYEK